MGLFPPLLVVAAALIDAGGRCCVQQRPAGKSLAGQWEFPGGKVEAGESPEAALVRELDEELGIAVAVPDCTPLAFSTAALAQGSLVLLLYLCRRWAGEPRAIEAQALRWVTATDLVGLPMPQADRPFIPVLAALADAGPRPG